MGSGARKGGDAARAARLESELRANLKKRKDQARARARTVVSEPDAGATDSAPSGKSGN